jgi:Uma2 family endonuclease
MGAADIVQQRPSPAELEALFLRLLDDARFQSIGPWELNENGEVIVSPVTGRHSDVQVSLAAELKRQFGGKAWGEQAIRVGDGPPIVPDVVWASREFFEAHRDTGLLPVAPPLCVEVMSASNSIDRLRAKSATYVRLGAKEAWIIEPMQRVVEIYGSTGRRASSQLGFDFDAFWATI